MPENLNSDFLHMVGRLGQFTRLSFSDKMANSEFFLLGLLSKKDFKDGLAISDIARRLGLCNPAVSRTVKGLEEKGWIIRELDPEDRRSTYIKLSPEGKRHLMDIKADVNATISSALEGFTEEEVRSFIDMGNTIFKRLKASSQEERKG